MPRPRVYKTPAIVLRQRKLGEADKIVTLFTAYQGKLDAVAKGVRRTKSRLAGHLEPLTYGSYLIAEGRDLDIVTQAETIDAYPPLRADLDRLSRGIYCAELVGRLTPERSEGNKVFRLLQSTLSLLATEPNLDMVTRYFDMRMMDELGYRPSLSTCAICDRRLEAVTNFWTPVAGGVACPQCTDALPGLMPLSVNGLKVMQLLQRAPYEDVARVRISGELMLEIEACLEQQVHFVLEREVRSARFVETLRRTEAQRPQA